MQPVLTPEQMRHVDANSGVSFDVLVERAGHAVAHAARLLMGGTYGRRVVVVAGKGNNGADGRIAARRLEERGAHVVVFDAERAPMRLADCGDWPPPGSREPGDDAAAEGSERSSWLQRFCRSASCRRARGSGAARPLAASRR